MRSARGDRHPPEPLEKQRQSHPPRSQRGRGRAHARAFCYPITCLSWTLGLRDGHVASLFILRNSPQLRPRPLLSGPWSPLSLWPPSFWCFSSSPSYPCPSTAPASPLLTAPSMAPQHPWEKSQGPQPDTPHPACAAPHWPLQLHTSLLPQNQIPLPSLKDPHYDAPGPLHKLLFLPGTASSSWQPGMFLLIVQDFKHHFFIVSASFPPTSPQPWPQLSTHCPLDPAFGLQSLYFCQAPT